MRPLVHVFLLLLTTFSFGQTSSFKTEDLQIGNLIHGTLLQPTGDTKPPLAILIQGSGPTDRNGNQPSLQNDALKKLAEELGDSGIASFRYDKRVTPEVEMRFEHFVADADSVLKYFSTQGEYETITIIGHSQGSLVGMLASGDLFDGFISIAGPGQPIDSILVTQVSRQLPTLKENLEESLKELRETGSTDKYSPFIASLFRPSVQPFLHSLMQYNPVLEISKLEMPILIINGTRDIQVSEEQAQLLYAANSNAELLFLKEMNHVLRQIPIPEENLQSYNEPERPLHPELVPNIVKFIKDLK